MRKGVALTGLVLLIIGIVAIGVSFGSGFGIPKTSTVVNKMSPGEWDSNPINITSNEALAVVTSASGSYGLVKASDLATVNALNIGSLSIKQNSTATVHSHLELTYRYHSGIYYFVVFSSVAPSITVAYRAVTSHSVSGALLLFIGGLLILAGIIVGIVGLVLRRKRD